MFKTLIPAVAALGLVAFAAQTKTATVDSADAAPAMGWHLSHEGAIAKLAYGVENSDQLALMMTCMPGDATAVIYGDVQPATPRLVQAAMGPAGLDPLSGGDAYETRIPVRDAALRGLADGRGMAVTGEAGTFRISASAQERRVVGDFLSYCGTARA
jgi:hypothetical protein